MDRRIYDSISLYRRGVAYSGKEESGHITAEYKIEKDEKDKDGTRTIVLKPVDLSEHKARVEELVNLIADTLDESKSKNFKAILIDTLGDYETEHIENLIKKIKGGKPVKSKEGCFKIIIGDGRKKHSNEIMLTG
jgi:hypothetical protein